MFVKLLIAADQKAERLSQDSSSFNKKLKQVNNQYAQIKLSSNSALATKIKPSFSQPLANIPSHQFVQGFFCLLVLDTVLDRISSAGQFTPY